MIFLRLGSFLFVFLIGVFESPSAQILHTLLQQISLSSHLQLKLPFGASVPEHEDGRQIGTLFLYNYSSVLNQYPNFFALTF